MMKQRKKLSLIILMVCLGILLIHLWPAEKPLYPTAGTNIVIFGDSLASGVGASEGNDIASLLEKDLGVPVQNLGVSGDTTEESLARLDTLLDTNPKIAIILLGGNDAIKRVPVETTFSNLDKIIERLSDYGSAVVLVGEPGGLYGNQYEKEYGRLAEKYRTFYIPNILSGLFGRSQYMSDLIHPNDAGYEIATNRILPVVEEILENETVAIAN